MAQPAPTARSRALTIARLGFIATVAASLGLGYWGLGWYATSPQAPTMGSGWRDLLYYDLQLFVLGSSPLDQGGEYPWPLQAARFLAPAATVYALFEAARAVFADEWRSWRLRRARGHTIITGLSPIGQAIASELRAKNQRVVEIESGDVDSLRAAGIAGAATFYACADDRTDISLNVLAVVTAARIPRGRHGGTLTAYAHVSDPTFALALRARRLGLPQSDLVHIDFFNVDELAARELIRHDSPATVPVAGPHIVVAGLGTFGQAVVVEFARHWLYSSHAREKLLVTLIGPDATTVAANLRARWRVVSETCDLRPVTVDLDEALATALDPYPHRTYLCHEDEHVAIRAALTAVRLWDGGERSVVVRLDQLARLQEAFGPQQTFGPRQAFTASDAALLDNVNDRVRLVAVSDLACHDQVIQEDLIERLAQAVHHHFVREQLQVVAMGSKPAMVPWRELPDDLKRANRAQARDIGVKLAHIGYTVAPFTDSSVNSSYDTHHIEQLAEAEHHRWMAERHAQGWTYAPQRDDAAKHHPSLVPWSQLADGDRETNRMMVRNIPAILADIGLQAVRVKPPTSTAPHVALAPAH